METKQSKTTSRATGRPLRFRRRRRAEPETKEEETAVVCGDAETQNETDELKAMLCRDLASRYVRRENRYFQQDDPTNSITATDLKRAGLFEMQERHPDITITDELWRDVCQFAMETIHADRAQTIPVWDGRMECFPDTADGIVLRSGLATINTWSVPEYRKLGAGDADSALFDELLERVFPEALDRVYFKDWLSWCLQNEGAKPGWSFLLYSQTKGTGKSSLAQTARQLFGMDNSITTNGLQKVTSRFNQSIMTKKFVVCEEVKLKAGTDAGNAIKAFITEPRVAVEGKGKEVTEVRSVTVFLMTTNHSPHWLEADDRRWYVADTNHPGHASGPDMEKFQSFMTRYHEQMAKPENLARLYAALMAHQQSNGFNARSLNMQAIDTPIMKRLSAESGEVLLQELEEIIEGKGLRAIPQTKLRKLFTEVLKTNANRITHFMNELGWRKQKVKWGGADYGRVIWVHPDCQVTNGRVIGPDGYDAPVDPVEDEVEII